MATQIHSKTLLIIALITAACGQSTESANETSAFVNGTTTTLQPAQSDHPCDVMQCHIWVVQAEKEGKPKPCDDSYFNDLTAYMHWEQPTAPEWFFEAYREQLRFLYCADKCSFSDAWQIFINRFRIHWHQISYSRSTSRVTHYTQEMVFLLCFSPLLLITNVVNVRVLKQMLGTASASIRYHAGDVYSDMVFGVCQTFFASQMWEAMSPLNPRCADTWYREWFYHPTSWVGALSDAAIMANQMFNLCLIVDRWIGLKYPTKYKLYSSNRYSTRAIWAIMGFCFVTNFIHPCNSLYIAWMYSDMSSDDMVEQFTPRLYATGITMTLFVTAVVVLVYSLEVFFAVRLLTSWRKFVQMVPEGDQGEYQTRKYQEGQKLRLLVGTIGISLICITPFIVGKLSGAAAKLGYRPEYDSFLHNVIFGIQGMLAPMGGVSSSGSMFCHILFTKTYRRAFMETFGRPIMARFGKVVPSSTAGGTHSTSGHKKGSSANQGSIANNKQSMALSKTNHN